MSIVRSERVPPLLLLSAAVAGLALANSPARRAFAAVLDARVDAAPAPLDLSVSDWIAEGLLAVFFLVAAIELRHELTRGRLASPRAALVPALAAAGGIALPALLFLLLAPEPPLASGWPIPTATDVAFALGVLGLAGRGLPAGVRATLLALAVLDDLVAILVLATVFTVRIDPLPLVLAVAGVLLFAAIGRLRTHPTASTVLLLVVAVAVWMLVARSGVHPTIAGVALGLVLPARRAEAVRERLEPLSALVVLPLFALTAAAVPLPAPGPSGSVALTPVFGAVLVALPIGKFVGITTGALIAQRIGRRPAADRLAVPDVVVVAALGGVGFTVSLLMARLAYAGVGQPALRDQATLAVLLGSAVSVVVGATAAAVRSRGFRRRPVPAR